MVSLSRDRRRKRRESGLRPAHRGAARRKPIITFRSTSFEPQGNELRLTGQLTLHGVTREITLTGHDNGEAIDRRGIKRRGFDAHTVIKRRDFGIDPTGTVGVAEDVDISLEVQLIWEEPDGAQPAA